MHKIRNRKTILAFNAFLLTSDVNRKSTINSKRKPLYSQNLVSDGKETVEGIEQVAKVIYCIIRNFLA